MAKEEASLKTRISEFRKQRSEPLVKWPPENVLTKNQKKQIKKKLQKKKKELEQSKTLYEQVKNSQELKIDERNNYVENESLEEAQESEWIAKCKERQSKRLRIEKGRAADDDDANELKTNSERLCFVDSDSNSVIRQQLSSIFKDKSSKLSPELAYQLAETMMQRQADLRLNKTRQLPTEDEKYSREESGLQNRYFTRIQKNQSFSNDISQNQNRFSELTIRNPLMFGQKSILRAVVGRQTGRSSSLNIQIKPRVITERISLTRPTEIVLPPLPKSKSCSKLTSNSETLHSFPSWKLSEFKRFVLPQTGQTELKEIRMVFKKSDSRKEESSSIPGQATVSDKVMTDAAKQFNSNLKNQTTTTTFKFGKRPDYDAMMNQQQIDFGLRDPIFRHLTTALAKGEASVRIIGFTNVVSREDTKVKLIQTRPYRAPEVLMKMIHGPSADIWSLGCMIYRLLTGEHLFEVKGNHSVYRNEEHLLSVFRTCRRISKAYIYASPNRDKIYKILNRLRDFPSIYPRISMKKQLLELTGYTEGELTPLIQILESCLEFVSVKRGRASELLSIYSAMREAREAELQQLLYFKKLIDSGSKLQMSQKELRDNVIKELKLCVQLRQELEGPSEFNKRLLKAHCDLLASHDANSENAKGDETDDCIDTDLNCHEHPEDIHLSSPRNISLSENSAADQEDLNLNIPDSQGVFFVHIGKVFGTGLHNFDELRKTCDRSFISNSLYIGEDAGIEVGQIDVDEEIDSEDSD